MFNCHHFTTEHLHEYFQFTIYHIEVSRVHPYCCEAQAISAISPKTCTIKLQLLCNTERPTNWPGHGKMIDPPWRTSTYKRPFTQEGNYLVIICIKKVLINVVYKLQDLCTMYRPMLCATLKLKFLDILLQINVQVFQQFLMGKVHLNNVI